MNAGTRPLLSLRDAGVCYRRARSLFSRQRVFVLNDISVELARGDSLGVIGRNGAGKSTLLRVLAGVIAPDTGSIERYNTSTALLGLQLGFDPQLSGRDNAMLSGMLLGFSLTKVRSKLAEIIALSELGAAIDEPIRTYSHGMRARLGFAVAIQLDPDVLLIDEVLGVGDARFRQKSEQLIHDRLQSSETVVLVSHQAAMIKRLCNKALWIEDGVMRMSGPVDEVVDAYEEFMTNAG